MEMFCYRLAIKLKMDVDIIKGWPISKLYNWLAFWKADDTDFQEKCKLEDMSEQDYLDQWNEWKKSFSRLVTKDGK